MTYLYTRFSKSDTKGIFIAINTSMKEEERAKKRDLALGTSKRKTK